MKLLQKNYLLRSKLMIGLLDFKYILYLFSRNDIVVAVVACGDRLQETLNMLKSALMFSKEKLNFVIVAEDRLIESFKEKV